MLLTGKTLESNPRMADADEDANGAAFLASDHTGFVTGAVSVADGGWSVA